MADNVNKNPFSDLNIHVCIQREKSTKKCVTAMKPILRNHPNVETMWGEHSIPSHKSNLPKHFKKKMVGHNFTCLVICNAPSI